MWFRSLFFYFTIQLHKRKIKMIMQFHLRFAFCCLSCLLSFVGNLKWNLKPIKQTHFRVCLPNSKNPILSIVKFLQI